MEKGTRVLVTGGTGFIGCYVTRLLLNQGHDLTVVDFSPDLEALRLIAGKDAPDRVQVMAGDISSATDVFRVVAAVEPELVVHLASPLPPRTERDPAGALRAMIEGQINLLEAGRIWGIRKLVWASAISVFGPPDQHAGADSPIGNDAPHRPSTVYGIGKSACERISAFYRERHGVDSLGLRFTQGYGPGKRRGNPFGYELFEKALSGEPYDVPHGDDAINWQFIEDIAELVVRASALEAGAPIALTTTGVIMKMRDAVSLLQEICPQAHLTVVPGSHGITWRHDVDELRRFIPDVPVTEPRDGFARTMRTMESWRARAAVGDSPESASPTRPRLERAESV